MKELELKNIDPEDIEDLIGKIENSFDIKFGENELAHIKTFGQLCDYIANKIRLDNVEDCTTQQAFYKLRNALAATLNIDGKQISPDYLLANLLPRKTRRSGIKKLEKHLGFKVYLLRPPYWVTTSLVVILLVSIIAWFFNWQVGLFGVASSMCGLWLSTIIGNELDLQTVGQLAEKMTRDNYVKSRRNPKSFNKKEIEKILIDSFSIDLDIDKSKLTRDAAFN